ncbi:MAG: DMT family transporter [Myxococcales bacterium]|nr:DMT family transporter [Myxococcales bacterium]
MEHFTRRARGGDRSEVLPQADAQVHHRGRGRRAGRRVDAGPATATATATRVYLALLAVQILFASLGVAAKIALRQVPPPALVVIRLCFGAAVFLGLWAARGRERVARADLARIALYAVFGLIANQLLFIEGLSRTTATNAVVIGASIPVFTVGVAVVLGRERVTVWKLAGLAVALAGALAITGAARFEAGGGRMMLGNLLVLANSLSYAIYLVLTRSVLTRYRALTVIAFTFLFGALGSLPFGAAPLARSAAALSPRTWAAIAYIVVFPTVGTYLLNAWALARAPSSLVSIFIYLQPLVGVLLAALVLDERPQVMTAVAGAAIFAGIALVVVDARRAQARRDRLTLSAPRQTGGPPPGAGG